MNASKNILVLIILAVIIVLGGSIALYSVTLKDTQLREQILTETRLAAAGIDLKNIEEFSRSDADLTNAHYISMKDKLTQIKAAEPLSRFVYVMGQRDDGSVFFYIDSEVPGTSGYSPPGQDYPEAPKTTLISFATGKSGTVGPETDRWGTWVSGLLPIRNETTGEIIGVFGMDIDAENWKFHTASAAIPAIVGTLLIIAIFLSFIVINKRKDDENRRLAISEEAYRENEKKYRTLFNSSADPIFILDPDGQIVDVNEVGIQRLGYTREEILNKRLEEMSVPGDNPPGERLILQSQETGPVMYELSLKTEDGCEIPIELNTRQIIFEGKPAFLAVARDITERKKADLALKESEARLKAIIDGSPALQFVIDKDHRIVSWNRTLEKYSGISAEDVIGTKKHWMAFFDEERPLIVDILLDGRLDLLPTWYQDLAHPSDLIEGAFEVTRYYPKMGKEGLWLYVLAAPFRNADGEIIGALETVVDVSERHRAEDAVKEVVKKLNLLSSITRHDILNKITMLHGLMMLISDSKAGDPEITEYIDLGKQAITAIQRHIEFTRTYQDIGVNKPEWGNVTDLINKAFIELHSRQTSLSNECNGLFVYADPLIRKVFYNLMDNSLRHGEHVKNIRCSWIQSGDDLVIRYSDDGCGIPMDDKPLIFEKGFGKNSGLGMFLAREILSITHITILENGEYQNGARFEITVPKGMFRFNGDLVSNR